jgi:hypothetical protein
MKDEPLFQSQQKFAQYFAKLLLWIPTNKGWSVTLGEVKRPHEMQEIYLREGKSKIRHSLHEDSVAADIYFFIDGVYQDKSEQYKPIGDYWKSLDPKNVWGGDWVTIHDGNHIQYGG